MNPNVFDVVIDKIIQFQLESMRNLKIFSTYTINE
jgi:hypothetical protein